MKLRKLKKLIFNRTDLLQIDDAYFARSASAAQRLIDSGKCASFATTLRRAMLEANMAPEDRKVALRILEKAERKERRSAPKVVVRRRAAIAAAAAVVISYFALVPQGRALAKSVIDWAVTFFDKGIIVIENKENIDPRSIGFTAEADVTPPPIESGVDTSGGGSIEPTPYDSIEEFVKATGKVPLVVDDPELKLLEIRYTYDEEIGLSIADMSYEYRGHKFWMWQDWSDTGSPTAYFTGTDEYFYKKYGDKQIICCIDPRDNTANGILTLDDSVIMITTANLPETWALFDRLAPFQP